MEYNQKMLEAKRKLLERFKSKGEMDSGGQRERLPEPISLGVFRFWTWGCIPDLIRNTGAFEWREKSRNHWTWGGTSFVK